MSRVLDYDNLSDDDLAYLSQRELLVQEITAQTGKNPLEGYNAPDPLAEFDRPNVSGTTVAGSATVEVPGNLNVDRGPGGVDSESWNDDMKKAELQAVIDARNADRADEDKIDPDGTTKADLVAALEADDES